MMSSTFLRREVAVAGRRLMVAIRLNRRLRMLSTVESGDVALPEALQCRQLVENRTTEYLAVLTRYRVALERALPRRTEPLVPRMGARGRNTRGCGVRGLASSNSALSRRKHRLG